MSNLNTNANSFWGTEALKAGSTSQNIKRRGTSIGNPFAGYGHIMKKGANTSVITAVCDYTTLNPEGGTFYFGSPIPNDGTIYYLFFKFES